MTGTTTKPADESAESDAINKNLNHPIPQFSPLATVGHMRKVTGKEGLRAIERAAKKLD